MEWFRERQLSRDLLREIDRLRIELLKEKAKNANLELKVAVLEHQTHTSPYPHPS